MISFPLCGLTSFFSYYILKTVGDTISGRENEMITLLFNHISPSLWIIFFVVILTGYVGLLFSIVTAAIFSNLVSQFSSLMNNSR